MDSYFSSLCFKYIPCYSDYIAYIQLFKACICIFSERVTGNIALNKAFPVRYLAKGSFSHQPLYHHSACNCDLLALAAVIVILYLLRKGSSVKAGLQKRIHPGFLKRLKFFSSDLEDLGKLLVLANLHLCHIPSG